MFEPENVAEIPEALMLKRAKLKGKFVESLSSSGLDHNHVYKPHLSKRDANKETQGTFLALLYFLHPFLLRFYINTMIR